MPEKVSRIAIVGASSLLGKEVAETLNQSTLTFADIVLLDEEELTGQMASVGDEISLIQKPDSETFDNLDFVFFVGSESFTSQQWMKAKQTKASVIDMTYALESEEGVSIQSPLVENLLPHQGENVRSVSLDTRAVISAHPAAVMLTLLAARLQTKVGIKRLIVTLMEPASAYGRSAMDELHQQAVNLLSFQPLRKEQYDAQITFNLVTTSGEQSPINLRKTEQRIVEHYQLLSASRLPELSLQLIHAPVFHGYTASVFVETPENVELATLEEALSIAPFELMKTDNNLPSNVSVAGQENIQVHVRQANTLAENGQTHGFWLWLAADNLKLAARNGIECALELGRLRPSGKVQ